MVICYFTYLWILYDSGAKGNTFLNQSSRDSGLRNVQSDPLSSGGKFLILRWAANWLSKEALEGRCSSKLSELDRL